jgi:ABC-type lipoprotein export system ATPase subunit
MTKAIASVSEMSAGYRRRTAVLDRIEARFDETKVHGITGASGCGKSTLLSVLGLLLRPSAGHVFIDGEDCSNMSDRDRSLVRRNLIGFVFQDALLEPSMTSWQNLYEATPKRIAKPVARSRAEELFDRLALGRELLSRKANGLSGGQAQRVAVARALLKEPTVVLADEPTGNLDDESGALVIDALFEYGRQPGRTCIVVTHDQRVAARCDTVLTLGRP